MYTESSFYVNAERTFMYIHLELKLYWLIDALTVMGYNAHDPYGKLGMCLMLTSNSLLNGFEECLFQSESSREKTTK